MSSNDSDHRVVSGMRPTGRLHLGHYHGVLKNWIRLQHEYECFFFVADWHALTTALQRTLRHRAVHVRYGRRLAGRGCESGLGDAVRAVEGARARRTASAAVDDHAGQLARACAELQGPAGQARWRARSVDVRFPRLSGAAGCRHPHYRAANVPVGADQVAHVEITREIARRFNHIYGREPGFEQHAEAADEEDGKKAGRLYSELRKAYQDCGRRRGARKGARAARRTAESVDRRS